MMTSTEIKIALSKRFCAPEWALLFEVAAGTGANKGRICDALAMSLWPSRGLELHGIEIKVSRGDWQRERRDPKKAEVIAAYCDRWWVVTAANVISDESEVPPAWGWLECNDTGLRQRRAAQVTGSIPMDRVMLAAILRRASEAQAMYVPREELRELVAKESADAARRLADTEVHQKTRELTLRLNAAMSAAEWAERVAAELGVRVGNDRCFADIGAAIQFLNAVRNNANHAQRILHEMRTNACRIAQFQADIERAVESLNREGYLFTAAAQDRRIEDGHAHQD